MTLEKQQRTGMTVRLVRLHEDDGSFDREFWSQIPPQERMAMVWDMVLEYLTLRGQKDGAESRLQRSICRIERRQS